MEVSDIQRQLGQLQAAVSQPIARFAAGPPPVDQIAAKRDAWLALIDFQETWGASHKLRPSAIEDRKLTIFDRALSDLGVFDQDALVPALTPIFVSVVRAWLDTGKHIWTAETVDEHWETVLDRFPDEQALWDDYLALRQGNVVQFQYAATFDLYAKAIDRLKRLPSVTAPERVKEREAMLLRLYQRLCLFVDEAGFTQTAATLIEILYLTWRSPGKGAREIQNRLELQLSNPVVPSEALLEETYLLEGQVEASSSSPYEAWCMLEHLRASRQRTRTLPDEEGEAIDLAALSRLAIPLTNLDIRSDALAFMLSFLGLQVPHRTASTALDAQRTHSFLPMLAIEQLLAKNGAPKSQSHKEDVAPATVMWPSLPQICHPLTFLLEDPGQQSILPTLNSREMTYHWVSGGLTSAYAGTSSALWQHIVSYRYQFAQTFSEQLLSHQQQEEEEEEEKVAPMEKTWEAGQLLSIWGMLEWHLDDTDGRPRLKGLLKTYQRSPRLWTLYAKSEIAKGNRAEAQRILSMSMRLQWQSKTSESEWQLAVAEQMATFIDLLTAVEGPKEEQNAKLIFQYLAWFATADPVSYNVFDQTDPFEITPTMKIKVGNAMRSLEQRALVVFGDGVGYSRQQASAAFFTLHCISLYEMWQKGERRAQLAFYDRLLQMPLQTTLQELLMVQRLLIRHAEASGGSFKPEEISQACALVVDAFPENAVAWTLWMHYEKVRGGRLDARCRCWFLAQPKTTFVMTTAALLAECHLTPEGHTPSLTILQQIIDHGLKRMRGHDQPRLPLLIYKLILKAHDFHLSRSAYLFKSKEGKSRIILAGAKRGMDESAHQVRLCHTETLQQCPWSKTAYLLPFDRYFRDAFTDRERRSMLLLMEEKGLHLRALPEEAGVPLHDDETVVPQRADHDAQDDDEGDANDDDLAAEIGRGLGLHKGFARTYTMQSKREHHDASTPQDDDDDEAKLNKKKKKQKIRFKEKNGREEQKKKQRREENPKSIAQRRF